jgi:hypothetical protein
MMELGWFAYPWELMTILDIVYNLGRGFGQTPIIKP